MSVQQSEARRAPGAEQGELGVPPPSPGTLTRLGSKHSAVARRRAAARWRADQLAEARALGVAVVVKPTADRTWTEAEDAVVCALYPDAKRTHERLPHRSAGAIRHRAKTLGIVRAAKAWTTVEVATLRRLWGEASAAELRAALPRWSTDAIGHKGIRLGLEGRGRPPLKLTGDPLCDAIRDRCRVLGYPMVRLDRIARAGTHYQANEWKRASGHRLTMTFRALHALGGKLRIEWLQDDGSVDTIDVGEG